MDDCGHDHSNQPVIKLDGSAGTGTRAHLTLYTKDDIEGEKEETFLFPYGLIDQEMLQKFLTVRFILGYKLIVQPEAVKE